MFNSCRRNEGISDSVLSLLLCEEPAQDARFPAMDPHRDPHPGDVGDALTGPVVAADPSLGLAEAVNGISLPLPAVEPEDPIGRGDLQINLQARREGGRDGTTTTGFQGFHRD